MKWKINISEENCTGCRVCQMICSWASDGKFCPACSHIKVESSGNEAHFRIEFAKGCKNCGLCAVYCASKALVKERISGDVQVS